MSRRIVSIMACAIAFVTLAGLGAGCASRRDVREMDQRVAALEQRVDDAERRAASAVSEAQKAQREARLAASEAASAAKKSEKILDHAMRKQ